MPKRSDRREFSKAFRGGNPFEGKSPVEIYNRIQWGNEPTGIFDIEAPEPIVGLGHLAKLFFINGSVIEIEENQIHIAIGANSNLLYFFPYGTVLIPQFSKNTWQQGNKVTQTDYYSEKGGEPCYYYHNHEIPYPTIYYHETVSLLLPASYNGKPSYAVIKEGIVG